MEIYFLTSLFLGLAILFFCIIHFFSYHSNKKINSIRAYFAIIGLFYGIISLFSFLWMGGYLTYSPRDFLFIYSFVIAFQSLILVFVFYNISRNKKLFYLIFLYLAGFPLILSSFDFFLHLVLISSFFLLTVLFFSFLYKSEAYKNSGNFGLVYAIFSLISEFFLISGNGELAFFSLTSEALFLVFINFLFIDLKKRPPLFFGDEKRESPYFLKFLRHFVFIVVITNFVFIGSIGLHEMGHLSASKLYGCEYGKIVYGDSFSRTEVLCDDDSASRIFYLAGLFPVILAIFLFFLGGRFMKEIALMIAGFSFIGSYQDFLALGMSMNLAVFSIVFGVLLIIVGLVMFAKSKTEEFFIF